MATEQQNRHAPELERQFPPPAFQAEQYEQQQNYDLLLDKDPPSLEIFYSREKK